MPSWKNQAAGRAAGVASVGPGGRRPTSLGRICSIAVEAPTRRPKVDLIAVRRRAKVGTKTSPATNSTINQVSEANYATEATTTPTPTTANINSVDCVTWQLYFNLSPSPSSSSFHIYCPHSDHLTTLAHRNHKTLTLTCFHPTTIAAFGQPNQSIDLNNNIHVGEQSLEQRRPHWRRKFNSIQRKVKRRTPGSPLVVPRRANFLLRNEANSRLLIERNKWLPSRSKKRRARRIIRNKSSLIEQQTLVVGLNERQQRQDEESKKKKQEESTNEKQEHEEEQEEEEEEKTTRLIKKTETIAAHYAPSGCSRQTMGGRGWAAGANHQLCSPEIKTTNKQKRPRGLATNSLSAKETQLRLKLLTCKQTDEHQKAVAVIKPTEGSDATGERPSSASSPNWPHFGSSLRLVTSGQPNCDNEQLADDNDDHHQHMREKSKRRSLTRSPTSIIWNLILLGLLIFSGVARPNSNADLAVFRSAMQLPQRSHLFAAASELDTSSTSTTSTTSGSSSSREQLNRAILATMSTQSTLAFTQPNSTMPRPLARAQDQDDRPSDAHVYLEPLDDLQRSEPTTGAPISTTAIAPLDDRHPGELQEAAGPEQQLVWDNLLNFGRIFVMIAIIVGDICGNSLVILSVCRHTKLRVTTNWFVVSLACADILVALFAMTFNASVVISGRWLFPRWVCDFWNSCDVLASTASILHLCCISIDRYIAITRPLEYPSKITTRRVMYALCAVWISSALLSYIPIFTGVYTTSEHIQWLKEHPDQCEFVVNRVYAIVSSSISFWIPCCIMVFTYYRIYREASRQEKFIYKAQSMMPAPMPSTHHHQHHSNHHKAPAGARSKQQRSKSMAVGGSSSTSGGTRESRIMNLARQQQQQLKNDLLPLPAAVATTNLNEQQAQPLAEVEPLTGSALDLNNNNNNSSGAKEEGRPPSGGTNAANAANAANQDDQDERDSNSGQSTPTKRSISKMKREHKAAKTLGIIMGVFILCWLPFFSWYTPQHICGHSCAGFIPPNVVALLFWVGYFNSTLNPIIYAYFNHEFRDAFKKTLQWLFCCCQDLKCLRVSRPNDNQHYNCTYRSTQEIGLVTNS